MHHWDLREPPNTRMTLPAGTATPVEAGLSGLWPQHAASARFVKRLPAGHATR